MIFNNPFYYNYTTFDEVFQAEGGHILSVGWARDTLSITAKAEQVVQIGQLIIVGDDGETGTVPATYSDIESAGVGKLAIFCGRDLPFKKVAGENITEAEKLNFDPHIINFTSTELTKKGVVIGKGSSGGAIGDAEIKLTSDATADNKKAVLKRLRAENGFKVLKQAYKG